MCRACHDARPPPTEEEEPDEALRAQYFCVTIEGRTERDWREEYDRKNREVLYKLTEAGHLEWSTESSAAKKNKKNKIKHRSI